MSDNGDDKDDKDDKDDEDRFGSLFNAACSCLIANVHSVGIHR